MTDRVPLAAEIARLLDRARPLTVSPETETAAAWIEARLSEPIRVAIAGRVKAGKSTLLNALVGERLAPTDAGECTKIVTWYRYGLTYGVVAVFTGGARLPVPFTRERDQLVLNVGGLDVERIERLEVTWPSERLRRLTLVDTPGLAGHDEASALRTSRVLGLDAGRSEVDAVIYLMRHAHRLDAQFLDAFSDRSLASPSPVNAVAVLSRADEIGAGRPDAIDSATAVAERYRADPRIRQLCASVVPVAGLIAETGRTLLESEGRALRTIAALPDGEREHMSTSVDRFTEPDRSPVDVGVRRDLLLRLGMFGVRLGLDVMGRADATSGELARALVDASQIDRLADVVEEQFGRRSELLKARSALINLKALVAALPDSADVNELRQEVERLESGAPELAELRLLHLVISGVAGFTDEQSAEVDRLVAHVSPATSLGLADDAPHEQMLATIIARVDEWRREASFALASAEHREACELMVGEYERLYADVASR